MSWVRGRIQQIEVAWELILLDRHFHLFHFSSSDFHAWKFSVFEDLISFFKINNLPKPYGAACNDLKIQGFAKYTKSACLLLCRARFVISRCKCSSYDLRGLAGTHVLFLFVLKVSQNRSSFANQDRQSSIDFYINANPVSFAGASRQKAAV